MQTIEHASPPTPRGPAHGPPPADPNPLTRQPADVLSQTTRDNRRVDLEVDVTLHYPDLGDTVTERTQNLSVTGMFVKTRSRRPPGTLFRFELDLAGLGSIQGRAEVVWVRPQDDGLFRPAGMGARFVDLDAESRQLIRWSVEQRTQELRKILHLDAVEASPAGPPDRGMELEDPAGEAGRPSALAELRAEVDGALNAALKSSSSGAGGGEGSEDRPAQPYAGSASARPRGVGRRLRRIASAIPLVPLAALGLYLMSRAPESAVATPQEPRPAAVGADELAPAGLAPAAPTPAEPAAGEAAEDPPAAGPTAVEAELERLTLAWAKAWSEQRARTYLAFYSPDFRPPNALGREAWEALREERILKPRQIRVEVHGLETEVLSTERARVSFEQSYRSDHYRDTVRKTFELVRGERGWLILAERTEPAA